MRFRNRPPVASIPSISPRGISADREARTSSRVSAHMVAAPASRGRRIGYRIAANPVRRTERCASGPDRELEGWPRNAAGRVFRNAMVGRTCLGAGLPGNSMAGRPGTAEGIPWARSRGIAVPVSGPAAGGGCREGRRPFRLRRRRGSRAACSPGTVREGGNGVPRPLRPVPHVVATAGNRDADGASAHHAGEPETK